MDIPAEGVSPAQLKKERQKARELRRSRWWQQQLDQGQCYYCGCQVGAEKLTLDHIVPLVRGGKTSKSNCVPACKECNSRKQNLLPMEWQAYLQDKAGTQS